MKALTLSLALAIPATASADKRVYDVKATRALKYGDMPSCGATARMMKDKHILVIDDQGRLTVNGLKWYVLYDEPDLYITFHDQDGQKTYLVLDMYVNQRGLSGKYSLWGVIPDTEDPRKYTQCVDAVYIDGTRR